MRPFNFTDRQYNQFTIVLVALSVVTCLCSTAIFFNPHVFFNFFEPTRVAPRPLPTLTATRITYPTLPPEWTKTPAPSLTPARPTSTRTQTPAPPTVTPTATSATQTRTPRGRATPTRTRSP